MQDAKFMVEKLTVVAVVQVHLIIIERHVHVIKLIKMAF